VKKFLSSATVNPDTLTNAVCNYIIQSMRPIAEVENKGFVDLMNIAAPSYNLPSRKTMRLKVVNSCQKVAEKMKAELTSVMFCAAQTDIWSSRRMHGFFGMCVSYIIDGELRTRVIACDRFTGKHTADNIAAAYNSVVSHYALDGKMVGMITDNASNMVKAFDSTVVVIDEGVDEDRLEQVEVDWDEVQNETPIPLPFRHSCVAHSLQLVVGDGLKEAMRSIKLLLEKCGSLVSSIHKSCKATELLEVEAGFGIPSPNVTRWNSHYRMISAINRVSDRASDSDDRLCELIGLSCKFTETDNTTLKELQVLLKPFQVVTEKLQSETKVTSSQVLPNIIGLRHKLQQISTHFCTSVKTGLLVSLDKRFSEYVVDRHYIASAALDPQIQLRWANTSDEECKARTILKEMCERYKFQAHHCHLMANLLLTKMTVTYLVSCGRSQPSMVVLSVR
jgi:hypothetical protein